MSLTVLAQCSKCCENIRASGVFLSAVKLHSREAWVIECWNCGHVFLHGITKLDFDCQVCEVRDEEVAR